MSAAFDVVFGLFVAAMVALAVVAVRWAVRRDRMARARQVARAAGATDKDEAPIAPGPAQDRPVP